MTANADAGGIPVVDNPAESRFEAVVDGHVAFVSYVRNGDKIMLTHTEVPKELQGRGIGNTLARGVLERARAENWRIVVRCPFLIAYLARHPEYESLLLRAV